MADRRYRRNRRGNSGMAVVVKLLMTLLGLGLMLLGVVITPLPGPFGVPIILVGLIILLRSSVWVKRLFIRLVRKYPKLLKPLRAMLRPGAKVVALLWLQALRVERRLLPARWRFMYGFRHDLRGLLRHRRKRAPETGQAVNMPASLRARP